MPVDYNEIAVFYRTNAQSRALEDMLLRAGVPYKIVGGVRFFERAEIRDLMAYLTLIVNPADDLAAKRIINVPRRGIGKTTVEFIERSARDQGICFLDAAELAIADEALRPATRNALGDFTAILEGLRRMEGDVRAIVEFAMERSGLVSALEEERTDEAAGRIENLKEFLGVVDEFVETHNDEEALFEAPASVSSVAPDDGQEAPVRVLHGDSLADFLEWVRLRTDLDEVDDQASAVTLMTVHAAKGLEFDVVFAAGLEESLFPHVNGMYDPEGIEEERRLAYVAITRARKRLYLTAASTRRLFGDITANPVSRFVGEIPAELRRSLGVGSTGFEGTGWEKRGSRRGISGSGAEAGEGGVFNTSSAFGSRGSGRGSIPRSSAASRTACSGFGAGRSGVEAGRKTAAKMSFAAGDLVDHKTFGRGRVKRVDGDVLFVYFEALNQEKKLLKDFAPIVKLSE